MPTSVTERRQRAGFTLVEVMVALALVSIVVFSLLLSASAATRDSYQANRYRVARVLSDLKMGEIFLGLAGLEPQEQGTFENDEEEANYDYVHWEIFAEEEEWRIKRNDSGNELQDIEPEPIKLRRVTLRTWFDGFEGSDEGEIELEAVLPMLGEIPGLPPGSVEGTTAGASEDTGDSGDSGDTGDSGDSGDSGDTGDSGDSGGGMADSGTDVTPTDEEDDR